MSLSALSAVSIWVTPILTLNAQRITPRVSLTQVWVGDLSTRTWVNLMCPIRCCSLQMRNLLMKPLDPSVISSGNLLWKVTRPTLSDLTPLNNWKKMWFFRTPWLCLCCAVCMTLTSNLSLIWRANSRHATREAQAWLRRVISSTSSLRAANSKCSRVNYSDS